LLLHLFFAISYQIKYHYNSNPVTKISPNPKHSVQCPAGRTSQYPYAA